MKINYSVKLILLCTGLFLFTSVNSFAQKVANYSFGKYGTPDYEHFSFWIKAGKRAEVTYSYGKDNKAMAATYLSTGLHQGKKCFKVELPGNYILYILPAGSKLQVAALTKNYHKVFNWAHEGAVNGIGTFCNVCAKDENEAMVVIKAYFMK
ncbi:hypothetical protein ACFQ3S_17110 [Mucilaginibacter terrae]|uniref:hypothetical protein n=1 Tax=Mucilaginibacter terrae TaxID=1955052 RepID=UPI0036283E43